MMTLVGMLGRLVFMVTGTVHHAKHFGIASAEKAND
jgi:hypothetical protein